MRLCLSLSAILLIGIPGTTAAESPPNEPLSSEASAKTSPSPKPIALVVSGGVSLGAYEAGYAYYGIEAAKANPDKVQLHIAAGTSAGSVNSLVSVINSCRPPIANPATSLGWKAWVPVGYSDLFTDKSASPLSLFSKKPLARSAEAIWSDWKKGLRKDCDVVLAIATTPFDPINIRLTADLMIPRQEEKFVLRIRGRGFGVPPSVVNYVDPSLPVPQAKLRLEPDANDLAAARRNFESVRSLVFASAAFPVAFWPQVLQYCLTDPHSPSSASQYCQEKSRHRFFLDGGVFDNNPLRLAAELIRRGLRTTDSGKTYWRNLSAKDKDVSPLKNSTFVYLDTDPAAFPVEKEGPITAAKPRVLAMLARLVNGFASSARARELYQLVETQPGIESQTVLTRTYFPTISGLLHAFMGFFEIDFRRFDFYLGMYNAFVEAPKTYSDSIRAGLQKQVRPGWHPFACMLSSFQPNSEEFSRSCSKVDRNFLVLMQVAIDRVFERCINKEKKDLPPNATYLCLQAAQGAKHPLVKGVPTIGTDYLREDEESEFDHAMRLLSAYGFHFKDLGLDADESDHGTLKVRRQLLKMSKVLADKQPRLSDKTIVAAGLRTAINAIAYEPPEHLIHAIAGTSFEVGVSVSPFDWSLRFLRLQLALQMSDVTSLISPSVNRFRFAPLAGLEFRPASLASPTSQLFFGVRAGYQFGVGSDRLGTRPCTDESARGDGRNCSQFFVHSYLAVTAIDRLRLQLGLEFFPNPRDFDSKQTLGLQLGFGYQFF